MHHRHQTTLLIAYFILPSKVNAQVNFVNTSLFGKILRFSEEQL